ncbi:hypothetical protein ACFQ1L_34680 [Phytohabitans flavus]|uniref:hypothetical protein n=1 Tax=Phytohabitans flavus TaxID=1076124 RepID=UPI00363228C5
MMDIDEARAEVSRIFDAPLEALTEGRRLSVVPGVPEGEWDLPAPDREALWSHGLPPPGTTRCTGWSLTTSRPASRSW